MTDPVGEENRQLEEHLSPVLHTSRPFAGNVHCRQVQHLKQGFIGWENTLSLGYLTKLSVVAFDHIGRVDKFTFTWRGGHGRLLASRCLLPYIALSREIMPAEAPCQGRLRRKINKKLRIR